MTGINKELYERMRLIIKERNHKGTVPFSSIPKTFATHVS